MCNNNINGFCMKTTCCTLCPLPEEEQTECEEYEEEEE